MSDEKDGRQEIGDPVDEERTQRLPKRGQAGDQAADTPRRKRMPAGGTTQPIRARGAAGARDRESAPSPGRKPAHAAVSTRPMPEPRFRSDCSTGWTSSVGRARTPRSC